MKLVKRKLCKCSLLIYLRAPDLTWVNKEIEDLKKDVEEMQIIIEKTNLLLLNLIYNLQSLDTEVKDLSGFLPEYMMFRLCANQKICLKNYLFWNCNVYGSMVYECFKEVVYFFEVNLKK